LKKSNAYSKVITHPKVDGRELTNQSEIRVARKEFYEDLYDKRNANKYSINLFKDNMNRIDNDDKLSIEGKLNKYECANVLKQMNNTKCPGSDRITT